MINNMLPGGGQQYPEYDLILESEEDWDTMVATSDWYGAKRVGLAITRNFLSIYQNRPVIIPKQVELIERFDIKEDSYNWNFYFVCIPTRLQGKAVLNGSLGRGRCLIKGFKFEISSSYSYSDSHWVCLESLRIENCAFEIISYKDARDNLHATLCRKVKIEGFGWLNSDGYRKNIFAKVRTVGSNPQQEYIRLAGWGLSGNEIKLIAGPNTTIFDDTNTTWYLNWTRRGTIILIDRCDLSSLIAPESSETLIPLGIYIQHN